MLGDCVFNQTRWRSRGFSGIKRQIKSVENRIRCLANFKFITQTTWPFEEHDQFVHVNISSVGNVFWQIGMLLEKGLAIVATSCWLRPANMLEIRVTKC